MDFYYEFSPLTDETDAHGALEALAAGAESGIWAA